MPNCIQFTKKGEVVPAKLAEVDEAICKHVGVKADPDLWYISWFNVIGFMLAVGMTWEKVRGDVHGPMLVVTDFLEMNYNVRVWSER